MFDENGTRLPHDTRIFQYRKGTDGMCLLMHYLSSVSFP